MIGSMPRASSFRAFIPLIVLATGCGSSDPGSPTASPSSAPAAASLNMRLFAHLDVATLAGMPGTGSGNWGYTSPDGRRFALTGTSVGLSVVEVTDPERPRNAGIVPGPANQWREVKTYRGYAYVTTEARVGMDIVDLRDPARPRKVQTWNRTFDSAHSLWIDEARGLLYANGTQTGMHVLDVAANPEDPVEVGVFGGFYIHDSYGRGTTLYAAAIRNGFVGILDVSDPANIAEITRFPTGGQFTHNCWLTADGRYLFTTDERISRPVEGWDLLDPFAPRKVSEYIASPGTIPHNVMVDGNRLLLSHYTEGVHLLDVTDPERPALLGFYDTYPGVSGTFNGDWGAYIFPGTDLIVASDIDGGLFILGYTGR
jgi:choice-of-anchor B domain-containing protein